MGLSLKACGLSNLAQVFLMGWMSRGGGKYCGVGATMLSENETKSNQERKQRTTSLRSFGCVQISVTLKCLCSDATLCAVLS